MEKYLLLDFFEINQTYLEFSIQNYGILRNYYCIHDEACVGITRVVHCVVANILAEAVNFTLIASGHPRYEDNELRPKIYPALQKLDEESRSIEKVWNNFFSNTSRARETPEFVVVPYLDFNFIYCANVRRKHDSIWEFSLFTDPFDCWIWIGLLLTLGLVSLLAFSGFSSQKKGSASHILTSLEPLLSPGVGGHPGNSLLFILWMLVSMVVVTCYSGNLTSEVISPLPESTLETLSDLKKENYSFIFSSPVWLRFAQTMSKMSLSDNKFIAKDLVYVRRILESRDAQLSTSYYKFLREISSGQDKLASFMMWPYATRVASLASKIISTERARSDLRKRQRRRRKCYVGKKMVRVGEVYYAVTPPGSIMLGQALRRLIGSGITERWWQEFCGMVHSNRVQDRGRVTSPTQLSDAGGDKVEELHMRGKTITIFLLWICFLFICLTAFGVELLVHRRHVTSVQTFEFQFMW